MKLPIKDINFSKRVKLNLEPYLTVLIFSLKNLKLLREFSKDVHRRAIAVYIGNQLPTLKSWAESHTSLLDIYDGLSLKHWKNFGVLDKPWVIVVDNEDVLLSMSAQSLPKPYFKNIVIRMKIPIDFKYDSENDEEKVQSEISENNYEKTEISASESRMNELADIVRKNHDEIERLRNILSEKNKIIENFGEKLYSLEVRRARFQNGTPALIRHDSHSSFNVNQSFLQQKNVSITPVPEKRKGIMESFKYSKLKAELVGKNLRKSEDLKYIYHKL